jgi:hypothetical protein
MSRERISRGAARRLIQGARLDPGASKVALCEVYELQDGRAVLLYGDGPAFVEDSYVQLARWIAANAQRSGRVSNEILRLLPQQEQFIETVDALIGALPGLLCLPASQLDFSFASLEAVDRALTSVPTSRFAEATLFAPLVAYVGEFIRRRVRGTWRVTSAGIGVVPMVLDADGREYAPTRIYKDFIDSGHIPSLASFVERTLR